MTAIARAADGRVVGVETSAGRVATETVVNAAGTWAGEVAALAGVRLAIEPRRGFILVTEPLPPIVRHKVYASAYVANVASDASDLQSSAVVEGTRSGTILIGASRERVGFDRTLALPVLRRLAAQAVALFPILAGVHAIRAYRGFRPYSPDHLPVIGPDPRVPGLLHACGHEGAGIGLAPATGELVAAAVTGSATVVDADAVSARAFPRRASEGAVTIEFDGRPVPVGSGQTVGAALWAAGYRSWRTTRHAGAPRGLFCGIGACFDCLVTIDGVPGQRACVAPARPGSSVSRAGGVPAVSTAPRAASSAVGTYDVAVVGGGPAGLAAAATAALGGCRVVLLDAAAELGGQFWRHRTGGGRRGDA